MVVKTDFSGFLNSDAAPHKLLPTEYVNLENFRLGSTDKGREGQLESIGATLLVSNPYLPATSPYGLSLSIGQVEDQAKKRFFQFVWNESGLHGIYCYDGSTVYKVLLDSQVESGLGFNKDYLIDARVVGNLLIYNDELGEIKCINTEAGIKLNHPSYDTTEAAYATPIKYTTITLIKRPPIYLVTVTKATDASYKNNFIGDNAYQFTYRFRYRDNQTSALASYSALSPYNYASETYNSINLTIPTTEYIDDDIFAIDLCVKYGNTGKTFIIKSWDKNSDADAITAHNAGTALAYTFYDDTKGEPLDDVSAANQSDNVPLLTRAFELAKNRLFLGNNKSGYSTPASTSLQVTVGTFDTGNAGTYASQWKRMTLYYYNNSDPSRTPVSKYIYYLYCSSLSETSYYYTSYQFDSAGPSSVNATDASTSWNTETNLAYYIIRNNYGLDAGQTWLYTTPTFYDTGNSVDLIVAADNSKLRFFKSNSTYKVSIAFYDRYKRRCGVVKNYVTATIPTRTYNQSVFSSTIEWTLNNTDALTEIPDWAYYYVIHITNNQTTDFFEQINAVKTSYVTKDNTGAYTFLQEAFTANKYYATAFDLTQLVSAGLGYTFTEGDRLILYKTDSTSVTIPVLGTYGNYVLVQPTDVGDLTSSPSNIVELYTPYKPSTNEFFYETAAIYPILNPGTSSRAYSTLSDQINGDCYAIERDKGSSSFYYCETMSPNDKYWQDWETETGWVNEVDPIGQTTVKGNIVFSDVYIEGTKTNGLNKFQALNTENLSLEDGALRKLILTSKTQAEGAVMLGICEYQTLSLYIGESVLLSSTGESTAIAKSTGVIAQINPLKGSFGTLNPESVIEFRGEVYWFDVTKGCIVFYSVNGIHALSSYNLKRFTKLYSDKFKSMSSDDIRALGNVPFILGGVNIHHKEIVWSLPKLGDNPNGTITDTGNSYPYDFYDLQGKTIVFKLGAIDGQGRFLGSFTYNVEGFVSIGNQMYGFKNGQIYQLDSDTGYNSFFGVNCKSRVMFAVNANPSIPKEPQSIAVESNVIPDYVHFRTEYPNVQSTDLYSSDFRLDKEGIFYSTILRDRLSPNTTGSYDEKMYKGDKLRGTFVYQLIEFGKTDGIVQLKATNTTFKDSGGHKV